MYRHCHIKVESLAQGRAWFSETVAKAKSLAIPASGKGHRPSALFTIRMGDEVEPRRRFIADNAVNVRNLDV